MMESKVFADNFSRSFTESGDFFQFLSDRKARFSFMASISDHRGVEICWAYHAKIRFARDFSTNAVH
jgi:hypothetical protein